MKYLHDFEMFEDTSGGGGYTGGVAYATLASQAGMGPVVASQPSAVPGDAAGASVGSGDIGAGWSVAKTQNSLRNFNQGKKRRKPEQDIYGSSSKRRTSKLTRGLKNKNKEGGLFLANDLGKINKTNKPKNIKSFSDFIKKSS